jgi:hypothetical protein
MSKLSENFTLEEFTFSQTAVRYGVDNDPPPDIVSNLVKVAHGMERVRVICGSRPVRISSGFRAPELNALVGGSKTSSHSSGEACDFTVAGLTPRQVADMIAGSGMQFDQLILEFDRWVHIGFGPQMRRQILTAKRSSNGITTYLQGIV